METNQNEKQLMVDQVYQYASNLFIYGNKTPYEVKNALIEQGLDEESAFIVIENIEKQIKDARNSKAQKNMLYGALWCIGGIALTFAHVGFIFWGAIVFGAIQFFRGLSSLQ